jgi:hypothetical protein
MHRTKLAIAGAVMGVFAAIALGQNADKNGSGPTRNDYRLGVVEPAEGATVTGSTVHVYVNTEVREQIGDPENPRRDVNSMPRPNVDVFLDGTLQGTLHAEKNVLDIENVSPGPHKLTFLAKNRSNEIIDRMETHFTAVTAVAASTTTESTTTSSVSTAPPPPAPEPSTYSAPPPAPPASTYSAPPPPAPPASAYSAPPPEMPKTASHDGELAIAGGALLLAAFALRRSSRGV